ncbi:MAG: zinc-dependent metalloprotease [Myxococcaceae bacterium]
MRSLRSFGCAAVAALIVLGTGCGESNALLGQMEALEGPFVAVPREMTGSDSSALTQALESNALPASAAANESFYIAINKNELGQKWFLSAYLSQIFPRTFVAGQTLGTRVVSFRVQNGKLFVFDVDDRAATSDAADPERLVEAYPIVDVRGFSTLPNAANYLVFDPSAGLNQFGPVSDGLSSPSRNSRFEVSLMFSQNFRKIADGVTFEQVFTGAGEAANTRNDGSLEYNSFRYSGTIGVALRRYQVGAGYVPTELPEQQSFEHEHYFRSDFKLLKNQSTGTQTAVKWNIKQGMKPIVWTISRDVLKLAADPRFQQYDIVGAVKAGVENWNDAFGFPVLQARIAGPNDSPASDDVNFLIVDQDTNFGFAFANWRSNPNNGEILGASVYFSSLWLEAANELFEEQSPIDLTNGVPDAAPSSKGLIGSWGPLGGQTLCMRHAQDYLRALKSGAASARSATAAAAQLTKKQKVERYITHVLVHEIGHTLGLRHNFKGSVVPTSSSVMEYIDDLDAVSHDKPGPYDVEAIKYLYGLSSTLPTQPFCTDDDVGVDPDCTTFDQTADPLNEYYGPAYVAGADELLSSKSNFLPPINGLLKYVRADADPARRLAAFQIAMTGPGAPVDPAKAAIPGYATRADALLRIVLSRLYLDPDANRGDFVNDPLATDPALNAAIRAQLRSLVQNSDKIRSYPARRVGVDILKKMQTQAAYAELEAAKTAVTAEIATLTSDQALLGKDLLARINEVTSPYFIK